MSSDPNEAAKALLANAQFLQMFEKAMGSEGDLKGIPAEGDPKREEWLRSLQEKLYEQTKKDLEEVHTDSNGQWMYILPEPGFCIKCRAAGGSKIFINIAQHSRIAEPAPMGCGKNESGEEETRFRVPLSCGQARPDKDKSGKPCKVYDVIVNTVTIEKCSKDSEFRRFVAALCMQWIQQKYEPTLNTDEFGNLNFKVKGKMEPQRIRLSSNTPSANAMGDEIKLPTSSGGPSVPSSAGGTGKLIEELGQGDNSTLPNSEEKKVVLASEANELVSAPASSPAVLKVEKEGAYDWSTHSQPTINPLFKEAVPCRYRIQLFIPTVQTIKEVNVHMTPKRIDCYYIDEDIDSAEAFLSVVFDYPVSEDLEEAKFVKSKSLLKLTARVLLPDETKAPKTKPSRDAMEEEKELELQEEERRAKAWEAEKAKADRIRQSEEEVMRERKAYVENLSALQSGDIPPSIKEDIDAMSKEQQLLMLQRLESGTRKGDSLDVMLDKLPAEVIGCICSYLRDKLSLEPLKPKKKVCFKNEAEVVEAAPKNAEPLPISDKKTTANPAAAAAPSDENDSSVYNYAKRAEKLFGVEFHNRYLFALDS